MTGRYNCTLAVKEGDGGGSVADHYSWAGCPSCGKGPVASYPDHKARCMSCGQDVEALWAAALAGGEEREGEDTWAPVDVGAILDAIDRGDVVGTLPTMLPRTDGVALLYPGVLHQFAAEPESGKSWLLLSECVRLIEAGQRALYVDFETGAPQIVSRLLELGASPAAIRERCVISRPDGPLPDGALAELLEHGPFALAVLDGMTEAYSMQGLSSLENDDAADFGTLVIRPILRTGAGVAVIDHVVKDKESRGRYAFGAQHKLAGCSVSYSVEVVTQPDREHAGLLKLKVTKDREGHVRPHAEGKYIANVHIEPTNGGAGCRVTVEPPDKSSNDEGDWRPTVLMERISAALEFTPGLSKARVREVIRGKASNVDQALQFLISDGYVRVEVRGSAHLHYLVRPYFESDEGAGPRPADGDAVENHTPSLDSGSNTGMSPRPDHVPDVGTRSEGHHVPPSDPLGEDGGRGPVRETSELPVPTFDDALRTASENCSLDAALLDATASLGAAMEAVATPPSRHDPTTIRATP